jgi:hypothetical protein
MVIIKKNRYPIPLLNSHTEKKIGELIGALVYLLVGERMVLKNQSFFMRLEKTPFSYPIADVDHERLSEEEWKVESVED